MISRGLRWDRCTFWLWWIIAWRLSASFLSMTSLRRGLLSFILATILEPRWYRRSFIIGRQALSWRSRTLTYRGSFRQIRMALFCIFCWKKVKLCNLLFEHWEETRFFHFSLEDDWESWAILGVAWALGWNSYPRYKKPFYTIWRWLERSRINGFRAMSVFVKR